MTTPQSQCTNLELSKKLKELGYPQESLFYWSVPLIEKAVTSGQEQELKRCKTQLYYCDNDWGEYFESISAPTVAELLEKLSSHLNALQPSGQFSHYTESAERWVVFGTDKRINFGGDTPQDALAKILIYLLENKLIEL